MNKTFITKTNVINSNIVNLAMEVYKKLKMRGYHPNLFSTLIDNSYITAQYGCNILPEINSSLSSLENLIKLMTDDELNDFRYHVSVYDEAFLCVTIPQTLAVDYISKMITSNIDTRLKIFDEHSSLQQSDTTT